MVRASQFWEVAVKSLWHPVMAARRGTVRCNPSMVSWANEVVRCG